MPEITAEQMAIYRAAARRRQQQKERRLEWRHQRGWEVASQGAQLLKEHFQARKVVLFGSLLYPKYIHDRTDVDLAVWGISERLYYRAVSRLLDIDPEFSVDLVEAEIAPPHLLAVIESEGVEL
ncbi:MAG: nucleotidyltransferase family protein [Hormoscilla sp.]